MLRVLNVGNLEKCFLVVRVEGNIKRYFMSAKLLLKSRHFHTYSELYVTGQDKNDAGQKQSVLKEPIQVKGKEVLLVLNHGFSIV